MDLFLSENYVSLIKKRIGNVINNTITVKNNLIGILKNIEEGNIELEREVIKQQLIESIYGTEQTKETLKSILCETKNINNIIKLFYEKINKDNFTGLYNKGFLFSTLELLYEKGVDFNYVFIDINGLKNINDTYGHNVGDQFILEFSNYLKKIFGENNDKNYISRVQGDEFAIVSFENIELLKKKISALEKYCANIGFKFDGKKHKIIFAYGIGNSSKCLTIENLLIQTDKKMYKHKAELKSKKQDLYINCIKND